MIRRDRIEIKKHGIVKHEASYGGSCARASEKNSRTDKQHCVQQLEGNERTTTSSIEVLLETTNLLTSDTCITCSGAQQEEGQ
jgi:hypothetical protein